MGRQDTDRRSRRGLDRFPEFTLEYNVDDRDSPQEVTIYDQSAEDTTTAWITADVDYAIPLKETL